MVKKRAWFGFVGRVQVDEEERYGRCFCDCRKARNYEDVSEGEIPTEILSLSACLDFSTPGEDNTV